MWTIDHHHEISSGVQVFLTALCIITILATIATTILSTIPGTSQAVWAIPAVAVFVNIVAAAVGLYKVHRVLDAMKRARAAAYGPIPESGPIPPHNPNRTYKPYQGPSLQDIIAEHNLLKAKRALEGR